MNRNLEILFTLKLDCITIKYIHVTSEMVQRERERERESSENNTRNFVSSG